ncbi:MAG: glycosyltransferase [Alphaproteobacteria bacterium]|nr:glycosyltransferase [Alphaproteobacteria bacterium]
MDIVIADDSVAFDGTTPLNQPLGGPEKAIVGLAAALAAREHRVTVLNRCRAPAEFRGVAWRPLGGAGACARCDLLIASRRPELLDAVTDAGRRLLWLAGSAMPLKGEASAAILDRHAEAKLVFFGDTHRGSWHGAPERVAIVQPGVAAAFREAAAMAPQHPPRAVVTTHPRMDLDWLLDLWAERIATRAHGAELVVYSAALAAGVAGGAVAAEFKSILDKAIGVRDAGVRLARPLADPDMAAAYRAARVHLYPGHSQEVYAATLAESQAAGLPAVARKKGAAPERIRDGRSGFLVPDDEAFVNCAVLLLNDDAVFRTRSNDARSLQRGRGWVEAAAEFEALAA